MNEEAGSVVGALREPLTEEQSRLVGTVYEPFAFTGEWPIWQYVDLTLDTRWDLDASAVFSSLPRVRHPNPAMWSSTYALTWYMNPFNLPQPDQAIALTVAGLRHVPDAAPLLGAFLATIAFLVEQQRGLTPSVDSVVEATVSSSAIADQVLTASMSGASAPPVDATMHKLRRLIEHEPILWSGIQNTNPEGTEWIIRVPATLRVLRNITTIDEYLDRIIEWVAPAGPPSVPLSIGALDLPYAVGYLDAVWMSRSGSRLFANLDATSVARLTQSCSSEEEFNSLMSALADVLGQVVPVGSTAAPQAGALEAFRDHLIPLFDAEVGDRVAGAINTLIRLRHIRVGVQHSDARHRAVAAFETLGLTFPPVNWDQAWARVAVIARGALDVLREEIHVGLVQR